MISTVKTKISNLRKDINELEGRKKLLNEQLQEAQNNLEEITEKRDICKKAVEVLDLAQQSVRKLIKDGFESVVTNALQTIYGDDYVFELEFGRKKNKIVLGTEVSLDSCQLLSVSSATDSEDIILPVKPNDGYEKYEQIRDLILN